MSIAFGESVLLPFWAHHGMEQKSEGLSLRLGIAGKTSDRELRR